MKQRRGGTGPAHVLMILVILGLASPSSYAESISAGGRDIVVVQPEGYCWLDMNGTEKPMAEQAAFIYSKTGQNLLAMFADCKELKSLRAGKTHTFFRHGNIAALANRAGAIIPTAKTRSEVLDNDATTIEKASGRSINAVVGTANKILPGTIIDFSTPRIIHRDQNALYIASMSRGRSSSGQNRNIAHLSALTVLNGIRLNVALYDEIKVEPYDFSRLLEHSKRLVSELDKVNP